MKKVPFLKHTTVAIVFWNFLIFYQILISPRKIINNKNGIIDLFNELPNDLRIRILRNYENSGKAQNCIWRGPQSML